MHTYIFTLFFAALPFLSSSCSNPPPPTGTTTVAISGREPERFELYRVKVPRHWKVVEPSPDIPLTDSRAPLLECFINEQVRITIHNFPIEQSGQHIPPQAQIERWKQQMKNSDPTATVTTPQSFSGYAGYLLETEGEIDGEKTAVAGWALQIGAQHERTLSQTDLPRQMRADITIKATGPPEAIALLRPQLIRFARSFELIDEVPAPR